GVCGERPGLGRQGACDGIIPPELSVDLGGFCPKTRSTGNGRRAEGIHRNESTHGEAVMQCGRASKAPLVAPRQGTVTRARIAEHEFPASIHASRLTERAVGRCRSPILVTAIQNVEEAGL